MRYICKSTIHMPTYIGIYLSPIIHKISVGQKVSSKFSLVKMYLKQFLHFLFSKANATLSIKERFFVVYVI
jgi:hypothetical protein